MIRKESDYKNKYSGVADLYDVYVDADFDIPFWVDECEKDAEVLELASGTGRVTIPLARAGIKVTAVDISSDLLAILRRKVRREGLHVEVHEADMRDFRLKRKFPLIILPFNSLQEIVDPEDHKAVLLRVKQHLMAGGRFIVTIRNPKIPVPGGSNRGEVSEYTNPENGHKVLYSSRRRIDERSHSGVSYQSYREYDEKGNFVGRRIFTNRFYVFQKNEFERLVKSAGFRVKNLYGDYSRVKFTKKSSYMIYELVVGSGRRGNDNRVPYTGH